jgi:predicted Zn-dependent protease
VKIYFETLAKNIFASLQGLEHLTLDLSGDDTQFIRLNAGKVRQSGVVENFFLNFTFVIGDDPKNLKRATGEITLSSDLNADEERVLHWISRFRKEMPEMPVDLYAEIPKNESDASVHETSGKLLPRETAVDEILSECQGVDIAGIYAAGSVVRGLANSAGLFHWFSTETFSFDYSLFTDGQKALKSGYAGTEWNSDIYSSRMRSSIEKLKQLKIPTRKIPRGDYRVYLAPAAFDDLVQMLSGGAMSEMGVRKEQSPLRYLRHQEKTLSPLFTFSEDFLGGEVPRFNGQGHLAPVTQVLIENGKLRKTLISTRTALEFKIESNGANSEESVRSPVVATGELTEGDILKRLGTGLYLSNLHYLNWSDKVNGRITGMTRYACFWVEDGKIICPIENLRFDETIFDVFGSALEALTEFDEYSAATGTYMMRQIGGSRVPGALLSKMHFSL